MKIVNRADKNLIKKINTNLILNVIRKYGPISRADISKRAQLNPATVSSNVNDILEKKLVREVGIGASSGGRKPILLELNDSDNFIIGVDLGINNVRAALLDINGKIVNQVEYELGEDKNFHKVKMVILSAINEAVQMIDGDFNKVLGIGMGIHGLVDSEKGESIYAPAFKWQHIEISEFFQNEYGKKVIIENDTRAMALGEKWFGMAEGIENFILVNIGVGIGAGIFLNGELYKGSTFGAGEIGHVKMSHEKIQCSCGKYGCFESVASGEGIVKRFLMEIEKGRNSSLKNIGNLEKITSEEIYKEALKGDELSREIMIDTGKYIGTGLSMLVNILNPHMVILAGGVSRAREFIYDEIQSTITEKSMSHNVHHTKIKETCLKNDAGIIGAGTLVIRDIFEL